MTRRTLFSLLPGLFIKSNNPVEQKIPKVVIRYPWESNSTAAIRIRKQISDPKLQLVFLRKLDESRKYWMCLKK